MHHQKLDKRFVSANDGRSSPHASTRWLWITIAAILLTGCGPDTGLLGISGEVSLDGVPIERGTIRLSSTEGVKQSATGAMIKDGKYAIPREKGLLPGTYHISITAVDDDAPRIILKDASGKPAGSVAKELIPAKYNVKSEETVELTPEGDNHFVFEISSE